MSTHASAELPDVAESIALYALAADFVLDGLRAAADGDLGAPTTCPDWDLRTLVTHVGDAATALATRAATGEQTFPGPPAPTAADPVPAAVGQVRLLTEALSAALDSGDEARREAARAAALGATIEFTAHGWDVSAACGTRRPVPSDLAPGALAVARALVSEPLRDQFFGPAVAVDGAAPDGDRFVGFVGRDPSWAPATAAHGAEGTAQSA